MDAVCEHLEAVTRREIRDLAINVPPGMSKSLVVSALWPAWVWTEHPDHRWLAASYDEDLALRDARRHRALVASQWYRDRWPHITLPRTSDASTAVGLWYTEAGGMRGSGSIRGRVTGKHCDTFLVDDPIDPMGASKESGIELDEVLRWWHETVPTRFRDHPTSARVLVMQRIHERDLAADMIRNGATVLCLPMRYESRHPHRYARDPRTQDGELLDPIRFPEHVVAALEKTLGPTATAAQFQQRPSPEGGGKFKTEWLRRWVELPDGGTWVMSWDCAFKSQSDSDFVVGQVWYQHGPNFYLVDQRRERMSFTATLAAVRAMAAEYPLAYTKLVEDKANGTAVIDTLQREVPGFVAVEPDGGKVARANACEPFFAGGNVFIPDEQHARYPDGRRGAAWVPEYVSELVAFPKGANDDQVDATTQALNHMAPSFAARWAEAMRKV